MTQLQTLFRGLCSDESMPPTLTFIKNGVETVLMKMENEDGGIFYVGTPKYQTKSGRIKISEHALVLTPDCRVEGTYALNSIIVGGWKGTSKDPGFAERAKLRDELISTLITAAILVRQGTEIKDTPLIKAVEKESGFPVIECPGTPEQIELMAAFGVRNHIAQILESKGWSLEIYPEDMIRKIRGYCEVVRGKWSAEANSIATTSALPYARVQVLKSMGYTLRKRVRPGQRKAVGHPDRLKSKNDLSTFG